MSTGAVEQTATEPSPADKGLRVLLAYASKYGSTEGVADRIAARLRALGNRVELHHADVAPDVSEYDAVIFGSPVFNQRWLPEAEQFARRNREGSQAGRFGYSAWELLSVPSRDRAGGSRAREVPVG